MKRTLEQLREEAINLPVTTQMKQRAALTGTARIEQNAIAVLAVAEYLGKWKGYTINIEQSDVWNPVLQRLEVADLPMEFGRLECRVVNTEADLLELPPEVWYDRIGYVYLEVQADAVSLLGMRLPFDPEQGEIGEIEDLDRLLEHLARLKLGSAIVQAELRLSERERVALVAQLERIYRMEPESRWGLRAEEVLNERVLVGVDREAGRDSPEWIARQELAERLMEKLAAVWNEMRG